MSTEQTLKVYENDVTEWVIAHSPEDAEQVLREAYGPGYEPPEDRNEWTECPNDKAFTHYGEGGSDEPVTKTFGEWIAERGRGFLATTEY